METEAQIQKTLQYAGETLTFGTNTVRGIPGETILRLEGASAYGLGKSVYGVEKVEYSFRLSHADVIAKSIAKGSIFTYVARQGTWSFEVVSVAPDVVGWVKLMVGLTGFVHV